MNIEHLYKKIQYRFKDHALLKQALTHSSYVNETKEKLKDNEILEFLGDAVIELTIRHILIKRFPDAREGKLSRIKASIVSEKGLASIAKKLGIDQLLLLGKGEEKMGGREKDSILADAVEALFGAIYLDAGFSEALRIAEVIFSESIENASPQRDYKSRLQEEVQKLFGTLPEYRVMEETGPPHKKRFKVGLFLNNQFIAEAEGNSKKEAEKRVAREGLKWIKK